MSLILRKLTLTQILFVISVISFAQKGAIRGKVIDNSNGEPLIGATVAISGTTQGSNTDLDGQFSIENVTPGTYSIVVSFISYATTTINDVVVQNDNATVVGTIRLSEESVSLQEVVVQASAVRNSESALLTMQRKSSSVVDGIASEMFSKNNDSDAASAIRRVTGVSVEGGKYVLVRGLGDRYSKTSVNKAEIPSLDPNKNAVQMDLFPSNLLDNMVVYKTFSPELPGSFSGGYVDISTKDFPDRLTILGSISIGYNTNASFNNDFLSAERESQLALGYSGGAYDLPAELNTSVIPAAPEFVEGSPIDNEIDRKTKSFKTTFDPQKNNFAPSLNSSMSFSLGNQTTLFSKTLGYVVGLSYQRSYEFYDNGQVGRYFLPSQSDDSLIVIRQMNDIRGNESVLWGALANFSLKLNDNNKIGLNFMKNQSADLTSRFQQGIYPSDANLVTDELQVRAIRYLERALLSTQLKGEHAIGKVALNWHGAYTKSSQDEPDLRFFNNGVSVVDDLTTYVTFANATGNPARYFRYLEEDNYDFKLNVEVPLLISGTPAKLKFGGAYLLKERTFTERIFTYRKENSENYAGDVTEYFRPENLGIISSSPDPYQFGIRATELVNVGGSYNGQERVPAAYLLIDTKLSRTLKVNAGVRYEKTDIELSNLSPFLADSLKSSSIKKNDFLPAVNFNYEIKDNMNLRLSYSRTVARPTFRELAQYTTFDFIGDAFEVGSSNLTRTSIQNIDLRWEMYPSSGEYFSASLFYKLFTDPIERVTSPFNNEPKDGLTYFYRNVPEALVYGAELEVKKSLGFISNSLRNIKVGSNITLIKSAIDINPQELANIRVNQPDAESTRPLFGQSPYLINAFAGFESEKTRLNANISYNVIGPRLFLVSTGGTPNIYEQPRNSLDLNLKKGIGQRMSVKLGIQNILNAKFKFTQEYNDVEYIYHQYQIGQTISFGVSYLVE